MTCGCGNLRTALSRSTTDASSRTIGSQKPPIWDRTMHKGVWIAGAAVIVLGAAVVWWSASLRREEGAHAQGARPAAEPRVVAQAQIVPIDGIIEVRPLAEGKVLRVLVQPGDRVETNQLLAEIESDVPKAAVDQRAADVKAASERLSLATEGVRPEDREALVAAADAARN